MPNYYSAAQCVTLGDKLTAAFLALKGTTGNGEGIGDGSWGVSLKASDLLAIVEGSTDSSFADHLLEIPQVGNFKALDDAVVLSTQWKSMFGSIHTTIDAVARNGVSLDATVTNFETLLYWYNWLDATKFQAMMPPDWRELYFNQFGVYPSPKNLYQEVLVGGATPDGLYESIISGSQTDGVVIDYTQYAGGYPYVEWTGGVGTGAYTITVTGKDQDNAVETWEITGSNVAASDTGTIAVGQTNAYSLVTDVTSFSVDAGITAGTFHVSSRPPLTRTNPPT
jgi:hypothetical protein